MKHSVILCLVAVAVGLISPGPVHTLLAIVALSAAYIAAHEWPERRP